MRHRDHLKALEAKRNQDDEQSFIDELLSRVSTDCLEQKEEQNRHMTMEEWIASGGTTD